MKKGILHLVTLLVVGVSVLTFGGGTALAADLCVNPRGTGGCYSTIQAAIDKAAPGQRILVRPGTYTGGVIVNKRGLVLIGQGILGTVRVVPATIVNSQPAPAVETAHGTPDKPDLRLMGLRPSPRTLDAITVAAAQTFGFTVIANGVLIQGFDISGFAGQHDASGIFVGGLFAGDTAHPANNVRIIGNRIHDNGNGIYLWQSSNATVSRNLILRSKDFDGVEGVGILSFAGFSDAEVAAANSSGRSGKNNHITFNTLFNNDRLAIFAGACTEVALGCGGPVGIHADITGTSIQHNVAYGNGADASLGGANSTEAIGLLDAHAGSITYNSAYTNAFYGILVNYSDGSRLTYNKSYRNSTAAGGYAGIRLNNASNIGVVYNVTNRNGLGIHVTTSTASFFRYNTALLNSVFDLDWDGSGTMTFVSNHCGTANPSKQVWHCQ